MAQAHDDTNRAVKFNSAISTLFLLLLIIILIPRSITAECYTSIFAFGDSLTDVGNRVILSDDPTNLHMAYPPYGETFFHHPTGRCSDGRLIIDFIAEYYGLPYMPPSAGVMKNGVNVSNIDGGVNFAVAGAATVDSAFYEERGIYNPNTNNSLRVQMEWLKQVLPFFCGTPSECKERLKSSLFVLGPFGSNDYRNGLSQGKDIEEIKTYVPLVMGAINYAINDSSDLLQLVVA